jgi:hypothetical protein
VKSLGSLYVGKLEYYHRYFLPIIEKGWTQETERPFRQGSCLVFRVPFTHPGFYIGKWIKGTHIGDWDDEAIDRAIFDAMVSREAWKPEDGAYDEFFKD